MTDKAISEARAYIDQAIKDQAALGYPEPAEPVVRAAVAEAAKATDALLALARGKN